VIRLAVSTLVLAALAVSEVAACPLGPDVDRARPTLPWQQPMQRDPLKYARVAKPPVVTLLTDLGRGKAVAKTIAGLEMACGSGRGEAIVRVTRGNATATVTGFDRAECVRDAIQNARFTTTDTIVRVAIELR
jgi:hypothetical protein